jgi:hypothetical protein
VKEHLEILKRGWEREGKVILPLFGVSIFALLYMISMFAFIFWWGVWGMIIWGVMSILFMTVAKIYKAGM